MKSMIPHGETREQPTREESAETCAALACGNTNCGTQMCERLRAAAAELRKTGATCKHFGFERDRYQPKDTATCSAWHRPAPADGSCHCHRWEAKPQPAPLRRERTKRA
jgi:hypothetical protein